MRKMIFSYKRRENAIWIIFKIPILTLGNVEKANQTEPGQGILHLTGIKRVDRSACDFWVAFLRFTFWEIILVISYLFEAAK